MAVLCEAVAPFANSQTKIWGGECAAARSLFKRFDLLLILLESNNHLASWFCWIFDLMLHLNVAKPNSRLQLLLGMKYRPAISGPPF